MSGRRAAILLAALASAALGLAPAASGQQQGRQPIVGFADLHSHQFANLAFGGMVFWGAPFSHDGKIATALPWSDWTPSLATLCPGQQPGATPNCSAEVVNPQGNPVPLANCPDTLGGLPKCQETSPVLMGTCPGAINCRGVTVHGPAGKDDLIDHLLSRTLLHPVGGHPEFDGWPRWNRYTGQQVYYEWLKRAHDGGLRLMVMLAVNNEVLCNFSNRVARFGCDDMPAVDRQIQGAKDLETFLDNQSGGSGQGWYRIAYSAAQARQIINSGKLAVVLGAEVPGIFGCRKHAAGCSDTFVKSELERYYNLGVRHLFPVHIVDNALGGTALYEAPFAFVNKLISGAWWDVGSCDPASGIDFHLKTLDDIPGLTQRAQNPSIVPPDIPAWMAKWAGLTPQNAPPAPPAGPNCNNLGITSVGTALIDKMMDKGMVIDVDHTSAAMLNAILVRAKQRRYPAIAMGHTGFIEASQFNPGEHTKRHEGNKTDSQIKELRAVGGLAGVILKQGSRNDIKQYPPSGPIPVPFLCGNTSEAWAQVYLHGAEKMAPNQQTNRWPEDPTAVAIGSDFNGLAGMPAPRFGRDANAVFGGQEACDGDRPSSYSGPQRPQVTYPFTPHQTQVQLARMQVGNKVFDISYDGLANVGMLPDFVEELKQIGVSGQLMDPLFNSAEAYVRMWERAEDTSAPTVTCGSPDGAWHAADVAITCSASDVISLLENAGDANFSLSTSVPAGSETATAATGTRNVCDRRLNCVTAGPIAPNKVDKKGPSISILQPAAGVDYLLGQTVPASYSCTDGGSGLASCTGPVANGAAIDTASVGSKNFTVEAEDNVGNRSSTTHGYRVIYDFRGFFSPVDNPPTVNVVSAGASVPVKFSLGGNQGLAILATGSPLSTRIDCGSAAELDEIEAAATTNQGLTYDAFTGQYVYVWKTDRSWAGTCRQLDVELVDGTHHRANFRFR